MNNFEAYIRKQDKAVDAADVVASYLADPNSYTDISVNQGRQILTDLGLDARVDIWRESSGYATLVESLTADPPEGATAEELASHKLEQLQGTQLLSGLKRLANPKGDDVLHVSPGSKDRLLFETAVANQDLPVEQKDLDTFVLKSLQLDELPATEKVEEIRVLMEVEQKKDALRNESTSNYTAEISPIKAAYQLAILDIDNWDGQGDPPPAYGVMIDA